MKDPFNKNARTMDMLGHFQMIEFSLKVYIGYSFAIIKDRMEGELPFKYDFDLVEGLALGKLIGQFARLNDNTLLHAKLRALKDVRDELAHRELLYQFYVMEEIYKIDPLERHKTLKKTEADIAECMDLLAEELKPVVAMRRALLAKEGAASPPAQSKKKERSDKAGAPAKRRGEVGRG
ncbi:hypothetical protein AB4059_01505 [Lysobacter sp. 2RAF19]